MSDSVPQRRITDPRVLNGLAQPVRQRLYRLLCQFGPATGGTLAKRLGADPGQVSYHLRELARNGFVEDVPELARDRRERWWRASPGSTTWSFLDFTDPEARAVANLAKAQMVIDEFERLRHFEQSRETWSEDWRRAVMSSESFLRLTPGELASLTGELLAVLTRWSEATRDRPIEEDRSAVSVFFHAFPERDA
ncbi:ArsR/SmtB family transcription factor [Actinoplanes sp. CA-142083]|uniref:ArsR/SmtB family transcription factor n=1 Tax=Actinoplanes sp. CA-142083 TaxID=3239903 RepID=UPI003D927B84